MACLGKMFLVEAHNLEKSWRLGVRLPTVRPLFVSTDHDDSFPNLLRMVSVTLFKHSRRRKRQPNGTACAVSFVGGSWWTLSSPFAHVATVNPDSTRDVNVGSFCGQRRVTTGLLGWAHLSCEAVRQAHGFLRRWGASFFMIPVKNLWFYFFGFSQLTFSSPP